MASQGKILKIDDDDDLDDDGLDHDQGEAQSEARLVAELRDFLDTIRPEDFNQ
jgi:hypothetical protein